MVDVNEYLSAELSDVLASTETLLAKAEDELKDAVREKQRLSQALCASQARHRGDVAHLNRKLQAAQKERDFLRIARAPLATDTPPPPPPPSPPPPLPHQPAPDAAAPQHPLHKPGVSPWRTGSESTGRHTSPTSFLPVLQLSGHAMELDGIELVDEAIELLHKSAVGESGSKAPLGILYELSFKLQRKPVAELLEAAIRRAEAGQPAAALPALYEAASLMRRAAMHAPQPAEEQHRAPGSTAGRSPSPQQAPAGAGEAAELAALRRHVDALGKEVAERDAVIASLQSDLERAQEQRIEAENEVAAARREKEDRDRTVHEEHELKRAEDRVLQSLVEEVEQLRAGRDDGAERAGEGLEKRIGVLSEAVLQGETQLQQVTAERDSLIDQMNHFKSQTVAELREATAALQAKEAEQRAKDEHIVELRRLVASRDRFLANLEVAGKLDGAAPPTPYMPPPKGGEPEGDLGVFRSTAAHLRESSTTLDTLHARLPAPCRRRRRYLPQT
eukprot:gene8830-13684_t